MSSEIDSKNPLFDIKQKLVQTRSGTWAISGVVDFKQKLVHASLGVLQKNHYLFAEDEQAAAKYEAFLRRQLYDLEPTYYGIAEYEVLSTAGGLMCRLRVVWTLNNPEIEVIAECQINNQYIYLWRDVVWTVSITSDHLKLTTEDGINTTNTIHTQVENNRSFVHYNDHDRMFGYIIIYPIGQLPSWMHL